MTKARQLWVAAALLLAAHVGQASDCSPGSPMYEDAFFAICDAARETEARSAESRGKTQDVPGDTNQLGAPGNRGGRPQPPGPVALDAEQTARSH